MLPGFTKSKLLQARHQGARLLAARSWYSIRYYTRRLHRTPVFPTKHY